MFYAGELSRATADRYLDPATLCGQSPGTRRPRIGPLPVEPPPVIVDSGGGDRHNLPPSPGHHRRSAVHDGPLARQAGRLESVPRKGRTASVKQTHALLRATGACLERDRPDRRKTLLASLTDSRSIHSPPPAGGEWIDRATKSGKHERPSHHPRGSPYSDTQ